MSETLRRVRLEALRDRPFILEVSATNRTDWRGQTVLGYELTDRDGETVFEGEDFAGSPMQADDSDDTLRALLGFLTLRPGDTDSEYFEAYTPGNHWLHVTRELPKEDVLEMALDACKWSIESLLVLLPAYRFILWEP